jgi:integrase
MLSIFRMAIAEGKIERNPAELLFTPKEAKRPIRRVMSIDDVRTCFAVLGQREKLIARLAILAGMRPGEIFGLRWPMLGVDYADIQKRIYRGREILRKRSNLIARQRWPMGCSRRFRHGELWLSI